MPSAAHDRSQRPSAALSGLQRPSAASGRPLATSSRAPTWLSLSSHASDTCWHAGLRASTTGGASIGASEKRLPSLARRTLCPGEGGRQRGCATRHAGHAMLPWSSSSHASDTCWHASFRPSAVGGASNGASEKRLPPLARRTLCPGEGGRQRHPVHRARAWRAPMPRCATWRAGHNLLLLSSSSHASDACRCLSKHGDAPMAQCMAWHARRGMPSCLSSSRPSDTWRHALPRPCPARRSDHPMRTYSGMCSCLGAPAPRARCAAWRADHGARVRSSRTRIAGSVHHVSVARPAGPRPRSALGSGLRSSPGARTLRCSAR